MVRGWHSPSMATYQFFLFLPLDPHPRASSEHSVDLLHRHALEKQIHSCSAHDDETRYHADVDDIFNPLLAARDAD